MPTLVVQGEGDAFVPPEDGGRRVTRAVAGSVLAAVADAPHARRTPTVSGKELALEFLTG